MRISDWSSDVCSSDLYGHKQVFNTVVQTEGTGAHGTLHVRIKPSRDASQQGGIYKDNDLVAPHVYAKGFGHRSEEHTSELQSLMRNSYAVFCLKKKTQLLSTKAEIHHNRSITIIMSLYESMFLTT